MELGGCLSGCLYVSTLKILSTLLSRRHINQFFSESKRTEWIRICSLDWFRNSLVVGTVSL